MEDFDDVCLRRMRLQALDEDEDSQRKVRCPMCGDVLKGRRGLNIHLRRVHFPDDKRSGATVQKNLSDRKDWSRDRFDRRNELKIQEVLVKALYGSSKVADVVKRYQAGEFSLKDLPINISYYIRLKGIRPEKDQQKDVPEKAREEKDHPAVGTVSVGRLLSILKESPDDGPEWDGTVLGLKVEEDGFQYVLDLIYDDSRKVLKIIGGNDIEEMLDQSAAIGYLEGLDDGTDRKGYVLVYGRKEVRKASQRTKGLERWIVLDLTN